MKPPRKQILTGSSEPDFEEQDEKEKYLWGMFFTIFEKYLIPNHSNNLVVIDDTKINKSEIYIKDKQVLEISKSVLLEMHWMPRELCIREAKKDHKELSISELEEGIDDGIRNNWIFQLRLNDSQWIKLTKDGDFVITHLDRVDMYN